ncbi:MAG TPA: hypothetical protein VK609_13925, partial [Mucilaginibacter sp.]|nr:hypothetical protein [Mucilaginibacter sp.]
KMFKNCVVKVTVGVGYKAYAGHGVNIDTRGKSQETREYIICHADIVKHLLANMQSSRDPSFLQDAK